MAHAIFPSRGHPHFHRSNENTVLQTEIDGGVNGQNGVQPYNENVFTRGEEGTPLTRLSGQEAPDYSDIQKPKIPGHPAHTNQKEVS